MGNGSSSTSSNSSIELLTGDQIEDNVDRMLVNDKVKTMLRNTFQDLRILVVGRSGCGKSTLIRVLLGAVGPRNVAEGEAGGQDIMTEWPHPDPALPLLVYESKGIGTVGYDRRADIQNFLNVHAVWYVMNAMDDRVLADSGLLEMLVDDNGKGKELPLLLIMTRNDVARLLPPERVKVDEEVLEKLLGRIKDEEKRRCVRESMVRVGNRIKLCPDTGKILDDESEVDMNGMELIIERTKQLIDKKLWMTWMACQVVDIGSKLEASLQVIVKTQKQERALSDESGHTQQLQLAAMFGSVTYELTSIWNVSENVQQAIACKFLTKERWEEVTQNMFGPLWRTLSMRPQDTNHGVSYALMVLGCILYIRAHAETDGQCSVNAYCQLCDEYTASRFARQLLQFSEECNTSVWSTTPMDFLTDIMLEPLPSHSSRLRWKSLQVLENTMPERPSSHSSGLRQKILQFLKDNMPERSSSHSRGADVTHPEGARQEKEEEKDILDVYKKIFSSQKVNEMLRKTFPPLRILVVGRSGCGKSTLIRVLLGDNGPRSIAAGVAGKQDIMREWWHPNPALPLVIHDTDGIDTSGREKRKVIEEFIEGRLANMSRKHFEEAIHAVWYVINAMDDRALEDCDLLEMLVTQKKGKAQLPLLLIMTNYDVARLLPPEYVKVNEEVLGKLLGRIKDEKKRKNVRESMVRVGNRIKLCPDTGKILDDESEVDKKGTELVSQRTLQLLDKELGRTWTAAQVVDIDAKLEASAKLIVETHQRQAVVGYFVSALPIAQQLQLANMYGGITRGLTSIWNVTDNQEKAIMSNLFNKEKFNAITQSLATNFLGAAIFAGALVATVFTAGIAAPTIIYAALPAAAQAKSTSNMLASYALVVLGCIIYIRTHETMDGQGSLDYYSQLYEEFMSSSFTKELVEMSEHYTSLRGTVLPNNRLPSKIVDFFKKYLVESPN